MSLVTKTIDSRILGKKMNLAIYRPAVDDTSALGWTASFEKTIDYLKGSKNVTIMGNTTTWGAAQGTGGSTVLTDSKYEFRFPITPSIGSDHLPIVDVKADGCARLTLDHQIDYSIEEITEMFEHPEQDTVLQEAVEWLED